MAQRQCRAFCMKIAARTQIEHPTCNGRQAGASDSAHLIERPIHSGVEGGHHIRAEVAAKPLRSLVSPTLGMQGRALSGAGSQECLICAPSCE